MRNAKDVGGSDAGQGLGKAYLPPYPALQPRKPHQDMLYRLRKVRGSKNGSGERKWFEGVKMVWGSENVFRRV